MVRISVDLSAELYKRMHEEILKRTVGTYVYGKSQVFASFAIEYLLDELEDGNPEVAEQLDKALAVPVDRGRKG
jgi:hypothetical protein